MTAPYASALEDPNDIGWIPRETTGYTEDEAYAFLTANMSGVFTASANPAANTGAMIALVPSREDLARLTLEGGEPLEELHLTLAYLGEADLISEEIRSALIDAAGRYFTDTVKTEASSIIVFNPHNPEMETAVVLGIKGEQMVDNHANVMSAIRGVYGGMPDNHKPWIPHVTLKYTEDILAEDQKPFLDRLGAIKFDTLRFAFGGDVVDIPLYDDDNAETVMTAAVSRMPRKLRKYWLSPEGSARVGGWGNPGSFTACQREMRKEGVDADKIDGLCANLYRAATGEDPGRKKEHSVMTAAAKDCGPGKHKMPDGTCMDDDEMPSYAEWEGVLTLEGIESGDGRLFQFGSLDWAQLPLKLMYQPANIGGHNGSVLVGQITHVMRDGNKIRGRGIIDLKARYNGEEIGAEVHRLMSEEFLNGVSVDVDKVKDADVELVYGNLPGEPVGAFDKPRMTVFHRGRIRGATLVAFPAFVEASIHLTGDVLTASAIGEVLTMNDDDCGCDGQPLTAASHTITIPDVPPAWWFNEPTDVEMKGALTITDEGRVFGRLAPAGVTHRSVKRQVPRNVDYSRFMGAETIVAGADGGTHRVVTGPITFNCGHASAEPQVYGTLDNRIQHYDNSCSVFADIAIGEDKDGHVWVAGAVKPYATGEQIQQAMSCRLSGDWQPHQDRQGVTEFVAALLVPVPGFATARKEASVRMEDGALVASVIPVEFMETGLLTAAMRKKEIFASRIGRDVKSRKLEMAARIERAGRDV